MVVFKEHIFFWKSWMRIEYSGIVDSEIIVFTIIIMIKWIFMVQQFKKSVVGLCSNIFCHRLFIIK